MDRFFQSDRRSLCKESRPQPLLQRVQHLAVFLDYRRDQFLVRFEPPLEVRQVEVLLGEERIRENPRPVRTKRIVNYTNGAKF